MSTKKPHAGAHPVPHPHVAPGPHPQGHTVHHHHKNRVTFAHTRSEFRRLTAHLGLIFSDFSTMPDNVRHASSLTNVSSPVISFGLSFSAVRSGLPFDFALQPGLVHVQTTRRLGEELEEANTPPPLPPLQSPSPPPLPPLPSMPLSLVEAADEWIEWAGDMDAADAEEEGESLAPEGGRQLRRFERAEWSMRVRRGKRVRERRHLLRDLDTRRRRLATGAALHHLNATTAHHHAAGTHAGGAHHPHIPARQDQIRFGDAMLLPRAGLGAATAAAPHPHHHKSSGAATATTAVASVGEGNGGDDFTFSFPRSSSDLYRVYAFGFDVLDDTDTENETLSIYDTKSELIGVLDLAAISSSAEHSDKSNTFYGFISSTPIGYASFDENAAADTIGLAGFVFGYKEHEESVYPPLAWLIFISLLTFVLLAERSPIRSLKTMELRHATIWLLVWTVLAAFLGITLFLLRGWRQSTLYAACFLLNGMLSGDNLFVFMMLLQQAGLPYRYHVTAISHGMLAALALRILLSLAGAVLLQHFSWLLLIFAAFLLYTGVRMFASDEKPPSMDNMMPTPEGSLHNGLNSNGNGRGNGIGLGGRGSDDSKGGSADESSLAVRCIGSCVPLYWSDATGERYVSRDESGRLCATRMAVCVLGVCISDVLFAMDSVPVVLSLTTSPFVLVSSQTLSLLWLRPVYFLLAALASYLDSMQQALAVVLVLISMKIFLEAAGFEVPLWLFLGVLVGWRVLSIAVQLWTSKKRNAPAPKPTVDEDAEELNPPTWASSCS